MILFISGTGTGVGKTAVACALATKFRLLGVRVGALKPVATGSTRVGGRRVSADAVKLMKASMMRQMDYSDVNPLLFDPPVSPHLAARRAGHPIRLGPLRRHICDMENLVDLLIVEGIGGVATPLTDRQTWADWIRGFSRPRTLMVCSPVLGTLNHTILSLEYLSNRRISCVGLVLSAFEPQSAMHRLNRLELQRLTSLPVMVCDRRRKISGFEKWRRDNREFAA